MKQTQTHDEILAGIMERNENTMGTYRGNGFSIKKGTHVLTDAEQDRDYLLRWMLNVRESINSLLA